MKLFRNGQDDPRRWNGIDTATGLVGFWPELKKSDEHPRVKLEKITHHLDFMGNGGSKWSQEKEGMERMLARVGRREGTVRMLLLRPDCQVCIEASKERFDDEDELPRRNTSSLLDLDDLRLKYRHFEIKLYEHSPCFRLTFTDRQRAIVGHYQRYWQDSSQTPLLVFEDGRESNEWSFYVAFSTYFGAQWESADILRSAELETLAKRYGLA